MSEALDKIEGIESLPIFPLPLVLMPFELLPLHIFEPRYRQMLKDVELRRNMFGLSLFEPGSEFDARPEPGTIGCVAEIKQVQSLPDERANIVTFGLVRYRLLGYVEKNTEYLNAEVEFFEDDAVEEDSIKPLTDEVFELFERIAKAAFKMSGNRGQFPEVPRTEPEQLSFLVAAAFNLENDLKYKLIAMRSTAERLERLKEILSRSVTQMETNADIFKAAQTNGHSKKPIDLGE